MIAVDSQDDPTGGKVETTKDRAARHLAQAAKRLGVAIQGAVVTGHLNGTAGVRTSGPAWLRVAVLSTELSTDDMWDGIATATGDPFDAVPMPHVLRSVEWTDQHLRVRADLLTYIDQPTIGTGLVLEHEPELTDPWWASLHASLEPLRQIERTKRMAVNPHRFQAEILRWFGVQIDRDRIQWEVAHGDLHFGNLTAPRLCILDWENWGWAPAGFDAAHLAYSAILHPRTEARARTEFARVLDTYSGAVAELVVATKYLRLVEARPHLDIAASVRSRAEAATQHRLA
ncbi:phosphotransferase family protein [Promicromonospora sp. NPDC052451]|uniref:phosphotransferase family protein n=1 Tax=Promicromonospora sp. NPDC052451 TaxID=3364407 RepID=UPI0037C6E6D2